MAKKRIDRITRRVLRKGEYVRKDGVYEYRYQNNDGKRTYEYASTLDALRKKEDEIKKRLDAGLVESNITLGEYMDKTFKINSTYVNTISVYKYQFKRIHQTDLAKKPLNKITKSDCINFIHQLNKIDMLAKRTTRGACSIVCTVLNTAVDESLIAKNPFNFQYSKYIEDRSVPRQALRDYEVDEILNFINDGESYKYMYHQIVFLLETGLRIGEFCGLTFDDIDFENHKLHINKQVQESHLTKAELEESGGNRIFIRPCTKTTSGNRIIPLSDVAWHSLQEYLKERVSINETLDGYSGFVFCNKWGTIIKPRSFAAQMRNCMKSYQEKTGKKGFSFHPHILRHTFCTNALRKGMAVPTVQYLMGHKSPEITLAVYTELSIENVLSDFQNHSGTVLFQANS